MEIIIQNHKQSVQFCSILTGILYTRFMFCTPTGDMKILIYELLNMYIVIENHYCGHIYIICFPTKL